MEGGGKEGLRYDNLNLNGLPQDCIAAIISFTSTQDACRLSLVSATLQSAAEADAVWESFLPSRYQDLIPSSLSFSSKKQLYLYLCDNPVLIDGGRKSLWLERMSGKKCYMLAPKDLYIEWVDTPAYWKWISMPEARFEEVPELLSVCWFEVRGKIQILMLSPSTHYKAYLVYKLLDVYGFELFPVGLTVRLVGTEGGSKLSAYLDPERGQRHEYFIAARPVPTPTDDDQYPQARGDGWLEVELGEFFNDGYNDDEELEVSALENEGGNWKGGIIVQGIEIRAVTPNPHASDSD